jgi:hypothetical protein
MIVEKHRVLGMTESRKHKDNSSNTNHDGYTFQVLGLCVYMNTTFQFLLCLLTSTVAQQVRDS